MTHRANVIKNETLGRATAPVCATTMHLEGLATEKLARTNRTKKRILKRRIVVNNERTDASFKLHIMGRNGMRNKPFHQLFPLSGKLGGNIKPRLQ